MLFVGPDVPAALQPLLKTVVDAINELREPGRPIPLASTTSDRLPPASKHPRCVIEVADKNCVALSTRTESGWEWRRADGGAL